MGLAQSAYLLDVRYDTGGQGHLLGFVGAIPQAQGALTQLAELAVRERGEGAIFYCASENRWVGQVDLNTEVKARGARPGTDVTEP